ncbi:MAG: NADP-dependent oxidoreductase [Gammaproteobacteria bacterium]|nr:NADP-dependent oxidoreductase [Gammaproteobacteria bacterium]
MPTITRKVQLKSIPEGLPAEDNFAIVESTLEDPAPGQVLVENLFMSVDPYMRGRMRDPSWQLSGGAVGMVIGSENNAYSIGDYVLNSQSWHEHFLSDGRGLEKIDATIAPISTYLGVMGMPGLTAYGGLLVTGEYKDGETVFVSAASGAVGSVVGQIVKIKGGIAVGSAGSEEKVRQLTEEFGFDHAFNYKTVKPLDELRKAVPGGIDIYFENVGGLQLEAALAHIKPYGRIPLCGLIAQYNDDAQKITPGPRNLGEMIYKFVSIRGFVVSKFEDMKEQFRQDMSAWIESGQIKYHETVLQGIENAPSAFIGLFSGNNNGKMLVKLAND